MSAAAPRSRLGGRDWLRIAAVSFGAALAVTLVYVSPTTPWIFGRVLLRSLIYAATIGGLAGAIVPAVVHCVEPERSRLRWLLLIAMLLVVAVTGTFLAGITIELLALPPREPFWTRFLEDLRISTLLALVIGIGMRTFQTLWSRLATATVELETRQLEQERMRKLALEARLASLESRLSPHFLFNTLNAVAALVHEDPDRAERTIERLSALLRFSLDAARRGTVPLAEELRVVRDYLEIEKARFAERLVYAVEAEPATEACAVPPLCVQTLVENSVKHAIAPRQGGGQVRVHAGAHDGRLVVDVWDDGPGFALDTAAPGHGLENLRGRLAARYGAGATLGVERSEGGTRVTVVLPLAGGAGAVAV